MKTLAKKAIPKIGALSVVGFLIISFSAVSWAQFSGGSLQNEIERLAKEVEPKVIEWRRDIHQNPELGNREFRTSSWWQNICAASEWRSRLILPTQASWGF